MRPICATSPDVTNATSGSATHCEVHSP